MALTITFNDPDTIAVLMRYSYFISIHDGVAGSVEQVAEGLILGCLDEHDRFAEWNQHYQEGSSPPRNVVPFPQAPTAAVAPDESIPRRQQLAVQAQGK